MSKRKTTDEFILEAKQIHGNKYDYSKVNYISAHQKIIIICPEHGEFELTPRSHLNGRGCAKCAGKFHHNNNSFIECARKIHGDKYNYDKVNYINNSTKVTITCPIHGDFEQTPNHHLKGCGCAKCGGTAKSNTKEFIEKSKKVHGNKYDYSKVNYINDSTKVCIICHEKDSNGIEHGEFWQTPNSHLRGEGCPNCTKSKGETKVYNFLLKNNYNFIELYRINVPKEIRLSGFLKVDFYLPDKNTIIEYNGIQHYVPREHFGGQLAFEYQQKRDNYLKKYCEDNNINLIEIPYTEKDNIELYINKRIL